YVPSLYRLFNAAAARSWGEEVTVKENAPALLAQAARRGQLAGRTVYLSPNTDPYLPQERKLGVTRALLEILAEAGPALVRVQTRSTLVERDLDLLTGDGLRGRVLLAMSVTTDNEASRRRFEPRCAPIAARLATLAAAHAAGVRTQACITPLLPGTDAERLANLLAPVADWVVVQGFQRGQGARTWEPALKLLAEAGDEGRQEGGPQVSEAEAALRLRFGDRLRMGADGFRPDVR
ncbi:MAG: radical SAM protein, partial [Chloroflexi bacterium]|nr:radical SAM protein [Chloroflexota bacterium]